MIFCSIAVSFIWQMEEVNPIINIQFVAAEPMFGQHGSSAY